MLLGWVARLLPAGAPEYIYEHVLRGPLRTLFNRAVLALVPECATTMEGEVVLNREDPIVSGLLMFGMYEPYESEIFRRVIRSGDLVADIGANVGYFTLIAAKRGAAVYAFEPEPHNRACLERTIALNTLSHVRIESVAIADRAGAMTLHLYDTNKGKHSLIKDAQDAKGFNSSVDVSVRTLDSYDITPDIIKMDIEGAEALAFAGMQQSLTQCRALFFELTPDAIRKSGHDPVALLRNIREQGFTVYEINERKKRLIPIHDPETFVGEIRAAHAANLYATRENTTNL